MTARKLMNLLKQWLQSYIEITSVDAKSYSSGAALHVVAKDGRKLRILIEEE